LLPRPLKKATWGVALAGILAGAIAVPSQADATPRPLTKLKANYLTPSLAKLAQRSPERDVDVIVQLLPGLELDVLRSGLRSVGGEITRELPVVNGVVVRLDARFARLLATVPGVLAVTPDAPVGMESAKGLATSYPVTTRAAKAWKATTGEGVGVAVIDSGVSPHADLAGKLAASVVVNPGAVTARDTVGHGTHVAGTIAGASADGRYTGTAPGAHLVSIKVDDAQGTATISDVIAGVGFAIQHKDTYGIRVLNLSLNSDVAQPYDVDPLNAAVEAAWFKGIVVVAAAGNRGNAGDAVDYAPANDPYVITVGGTDDKGTEGLGDDALASWSSRGTTESGFRKPEITAPGKGIVSTLAAGSGFAEQCPSCVVDGDYLRIGGTSMATAVVSGLVANLLQARPELTPDQVKGALVATAAGKHDTADVQAAIGARNPSSNRGLTPNDAIDPETGEVRGADWSRSSWSQATGALSADWSRSSWSCAECSAEGPSAEWTRSSWSRSSWSRSSWSSAAGR
jgi:serine protease AprX